MLLLRLPGYPFLFSPLPVVPQQQAAWREALQSCLCLCAAAAAAAAASYICDIYAYI
jgi:hypothetical protein